MVNRHWFGSKAWCRKATSHYLSQCWPRSLSPYGMTRPQRVKYQIYHVIRIEVLHVFWIYDWALCRHCEWVSSTLRCAFGYSSGPSFNWISRWNLNVTRVPFWLNTEYRIQNTESLLSTVIQLQIIGTQGQQSHYTTWLDYHSNDSVFATHNITRYPSCLTHYRI